MTLCWIIAQLFHHTFLHYNSLLSVHQLKENHTENHLHFQRTGTGVFSQSIFMQCRLQPLPHHHGHTEGASTPNVQSLIFRGFCLFVCLFVSRSSAALLTRLIFPSYKCSWLPENSLRMYWRNKMTVGHESNCMWNTTTVAYRRAQMRSLHSWADRW